MALTSLGASSADALLGRRQSCLRASICSPRRTERVAALVLPQGPRVMLAGGLVPHSLPTGVRRGRR